MSTQETSHTYLGFWINWSHGVVRGSTVTLAYRDGGLLTAFLALFVAIAGGALWRIMAFVFHQLGASQGVQDGLHHQQQAILRNTSSPGVAFWQFTQLSYFWWQFAPRPLWRSIKFSFLALLSLTMLAAASLFSSLLTRATSNETLIVSDNCGIWVMDTTHTDSVSRRARRHKDLRDIISAAGYARACYGSDPDTLQCNQYIQRQIYSTANRNATCPFASGICMISDTAAYQLDTGFIDSHFHLGINTPEKDRVIYRRRQTCAPLNQEDYTTIRSITETSDPNDQKLGMPGDSISFYNFGPVGESNWTYYYNLHAGIGDFAYSLSSNVHIGGYASGRWIPIEALRREDADVSIVFMTANSVYYAGEVHDPLFAADQRSYSFIISDTNYTYYFSNFDVNVMACIDQHQFCNPTNYQCTDLTSSYTALNQAKDLDMNVVQDLTMLRFSFQLDSSSLDSSLAGRGGAALRAQELVQDLLSDPLPNDQWMIEVESWFSTGLARLQKAMVEHAAGPQNVIYGAHIEKPRNFIEKKMCHNQLVHSTSDTISFSTLGLALVLITGSILILTNLVLDTIVGLVQQIFNTGGHRRLQWIVDEKLQLQRLAFEEARMGTWSGGAAAVPVTRFGEKFGIPLDTDPNHPRLRGYMKATRDEEHESTRLMHDKTNSTVMTTQL